MLEMGACALTTRFDPEEAVKTEFELSLYDLQDLFDDGAEATREAYLRSHFGEKVGVLYYVGVG